MADSAAIGALVVAVIVLSAAIVFGAFAFARAQTLWAKERTELLNRILADNPREFAHLQKATAPPKPEVPDPNIDEPALIGTY